MRELNVKEVKKVSGGLVIGLFGGWAFGEAMTWGRNNTEMLGRWAYNGGRYRRSMP